MVDVVFLLKKMILKVVWSDTRPLKSAKTRKPPTFLLTSAKMLQRSRNLDIIEFRRSKTSYSAHKLRLPSCVFFCEINPFRAVRVNTVSVKRALSSFLPVSRHIVENQFLRLGHHYHRVQNAFLKHNRWNRSLRMKKILRLDNVCIFIMTVLLRVAFLHLWFSCHLHFSLSKNLYAKQNFMHNWADSQSKNTT